MLTILHNVYVSHNINTQRHDKANKKVCKMDEYAFCGMGFTLFVGRITYALMSRLFIKK